MEASGRQEGLKRGGKKAKQLLSIHGPCIAGAHSFPENIERC